MTSVEFTKMHGLGNDFMVVNNLDGQYNFDAAQILAWSNRHTGIGFDQMLVLEQATNTERPFRDLQPARDRDEGGRAQLLTGLQRSSTLHVSVTSCC